MHTTKTYAAVLVLVSGCLTVLAQCLLNQNQHNRRLKLPSHSSIISMSPRLIAALTLVSTSMNTHARSGSPRILYLPSRPTGGWAQS